MQVAPSYQGSQGQGVPAAAGAPSVQSRTAFFVWLFVIGVVLPALVLGGLRAGGFQFVYKRR